MGRWRYGKLRDLVRWARCQREVWGRIEGENNKRDVLMKGHFGFMEKPGAKETPALHKDEPS